MSSGQNYMLNELDAIYKLGWSPIGCEDFSIPRSIKTIQNWGIGIGSSPIVYEGFVQPRKGQGESKTKLSKLVLQ